MEAIKALMRVFSYLFHALLALVLIAVSTLALSVGADSLKLGMLPWTGQTLAYALFFGALIGLLTLVLALRNTLRFLFLLWSLAVAYFIIKGFFFSGYRFEGGHVNTALYLTAGSLLAILGAWFQFIRPLKRRY